MKLQLILVPVFLLSSAYAGNKVERETLAEFPCGLQIVGQINVSKGLGLALRDFDKDKDGLLTSYCRTTLTQLDTNADGQTDQIISDSRYQFFNCTKVKEIERTKQGQIVREEYVYMRELKKSSDLGAGCETAAQTLKDLIDKTKELAEKEPLSQEADVLNTLGNSNRVVINVP